VVFTHGDFQAAHILYDRDTITGVIDWADACAGDATFDLAVLTVGHEERVTDVLAGYGDDVDIDVLTAWWAVRRIGSVRWMIEHGFNADDDVSALIKTAQS
jgi:aminoglycoside phosphotransferase (APT) family kinase protein